VGWGLFRRGIANRHTGESPDRKSWPSRFGGRVGGVVVLQHLLVSFKEISRTAYVTDSTRSALRDWQNNKIQIRMA
jgi:hypothetical protein